MLKKFLQMAAATACGLVFSASALAQDGRVGMAKEKEINFQPPATEVMDGIVNLHTEVFYIITAIMILVLGLLLICMVRFNSKTNPKPSKTSHNTLLEIVWTIIPVIILTVICFSSIKLLYKQDVIPEADMVIKATGHQWYWSYEYPDQGIAFDANVVPDAYVLGTADEVTKQDWDQRFEELRVNLGWEQPIVPKRLLDTDTRLVVPVDTTIKVIVTADDVIHSWAVPAFGFKIDAIPGRINETWFHAREIGTFYGQCSELCGIRHAFMPIVVQVVSKEDYQAWLTRAESFYAANGVAAGPKMADGSGE